MGGMSRDWLTVDWKGGRDGRLFEVSKPSPTLRVDLIANVTADHRFIDIKKHDVIESWVDIAPHFHRVQGGSDRLISACGKKAPSSFTSVLFFSLTISHLFSDDLSKSGRDLICLKRGIRTESI